MENLHCDICGASMREGDYGEARWICSNDHCEKYDPNWPIKRLNQKLKPINDEIDEMSFFSSGSIEMYMVRWVGDGSFNVKFNDGKELECHVKDELVYPDLPEITAEIKSKLFHLIKLREKLSQEIKQGS